MLKIRLGFPRAGFNTVHFYVQPDSITAIHPPAPEYARQLNSNFDLDTLLQTISRRFNGKSLSIRPYTQDLEVQGIMITIPRQPKNISIVENRFYGGRHHRTPVFPGTHILTPDSCSMTLTSTNITEGTYNSATILYQTK